MNFGELCVELWHGYIAEFIVHVATQMVSKVKGCETPSPDKNLLRCLERLRVPITKRVLCLVHVLTLIFLGSGVKLPPVKTSSDGEDDNICNFGTENVLKDAALDLGLFF